MNDPDDNMYDDYDDDPVDCSNCDGEGYIDRHDEDPLWYGHELYPCDWCWGKGTFPRLNAPKAST